LAKTAKSKVENKNLAENRNPEVVFGRHFGEEMNFYVFLKTFSAPCHGIWASKFTHGAEH